MNLDRLRKLTAEQLRNLDPQEVFQSEEFAQHLQRLTEEIMKIGGRPSNNLKVHVVCIPGGHPGWTDGNDIYVNTQNTISGHYTRVLEQFTALRGICFHECAHLLYLDFTEEKRALKSLEDGKFYGSLPTPSNAEEDTLLQEMQAALDNPLYRPIFGQVFNDVANTTDDPHDEGKIIQAFGGIVEQGIVFARDAIFRSFDTAENIIAEPGSDLSKLYWLMLEYARFETISVRDEAVFQTDPLLRCIVSMARDIATARWTDDQKVRFGAINRMMLSLWPYIKAELDAQDNQKPNNEQSSGSHEGDQKQAGQQGGQASQPEQQHSQQGQHTGQEPQPGHQDSQKNQSEQGQDARSGQHGRSHSKEAIQQVLEQLQKASGSMNDSMSPQPKGQKSSDTAVANRKASRKGKQEAAPEEKPGKDVSDLTSLQHAFDRLREEIAERKAVDAAERDLASDLMIEIDQTAKGITAPCKVVTSRNLRIDDSDVRLYQKQMESVADYSKRMKKRMNDALRDMQDGGIKHHRQMGRIVEARYAYRPDQRYYASKKMPDNWPTMAISVLVDLSGSMHGERLDAAMKATMLLHDFATGLGIPIFIAGHNATGDRVNYNVMAEFNGVDTRDKYRLAHMYLGGDNYDGIAIDLSGSLLAKRSEDVKLLFIISDGQPNHEGYRGDAAKKDIQEIVTKYRRKGIITFATAIGSDRDKIRAIYGDGYLDISDLSEFPKQLTRMVAKRILRN